MQAPATSSATGPAERVTTLSRQSLDALRAIEDLFEAAKGMMVPRPGTSAASAVVRAAAAE
jgi:hypothetical protein